MTRNRPMPRNLYRVFSLLIFLIAGCSTVPMEMRTVVEKGQIRKLEKVLIVYDGSPFPDAIRQSFFDPIVVAIAKNLAERGVGSWQMAPVKSSLNPGLQTMAYARQLGASHVLHVSANNVVTYGPRNSTDEYSKQLRFLSSYELGFILADVAKGRNVWKGMLRSGSQFKGSHQEQLEIVAQLTTSLAREGFFSPTGVSGLSASTKSFTPNFGKSDAQDRNGDGISDAGELKTLTQAGIQRIGLTSAPTDWTSGGNHVAGFGKFQRTDGSTGWTADVGLGKRSRLHSVPSIPAGNFTQWRMAA